MNATPVRELIRRQWYVVERLRRLDDERKLLIEETRNASVTLDIKRITRLRAYAQVRLADIQEENSSLSRESGRLKQAIATAKAAKTGEPT